MKKNTIRKQSGSTLIVVMGVLATLMVIVGVAAEYTNTINRSVQRSNIQGNAIAVGDSSLELLFANWRSVCRASPTQALATSAFSSIALPTSSMFPDLTYLPNFTFGASRTDYYTSGTANPPTISNYKIVATDAEWQPLAGGGATPEPIMGQVSQDMDDASKLPKTPAVFNYLASADITLPTTTGKVVAKVRRVFQKQQLSPWNFAIFYVDPLEIHPGPLFTVTGWVHTNSDLYTGHLSLTFADKVTYASDWFSSTLTNLGLGFKPGDLVHDPTDPANGPPNYVTNLPPTRDQALQPFGMDSTSIFNTTDANPNNDSYRELIEPPTNASDPLAASRYWDQANVAIKISDNPNPNAPGFDGVNGHDLVTIGTPNADGSITPAGAGNWRLTMFTGAITTNQSIQDNREAAPIRLATLDLSQILTPSTTPATYKSANFNGIVYVYNASNSSSNRRGIRIKGGSLIPSSGLSIASNNPVYIQGDFNTGGTGATVPSNNPANFNADGTYINQANPPNSYVNGYTRAPCSILADAINLLSANWNDNNSNADVYSSGLRNAIPTTFNTAVIAGIVPTAPVGGDGSYSGGAENFPRFLENWANKTLTYYGSMVELFKSNQSIGEWGRANVYSPPTREWYFDTNFRTKPPPGSIMIYSYIKGKWSVL